MAFDTLVTMNCFASPSVARTTIHALGVRGRTDGVPPSRMPGDCRTGRRRGAARAMPGCGRDLSETGGGRTRIDRRCTAHAERLSAGSRDAGRGASLIFSGTSVGLPSYTQRRTAAAASSPKRDSPSQKPAPDRVRCWEASKGRACQADERGLLFLSFCLSVFLFFVLRFLRPRFRATLSAAPTRLPHRDGRRQGIRRLRPRPRLCADHRRAATCEISSARGTWDRTSSCAARS